MRVELIDRAGAPTTPAERDRWMGEALAEAAEETPEGVVIALTGNVHSRVGDGTPWGPAYETAGFVLASRKPGLRLTSLDVAYQGGTAWTCTSGDAASCQARALRGRAGVGAGRVTLHPQVTNGHHGFYEVGTLTASPPARRAAGG